MVAWAEKSSGGFQAVPYPELQEGRYYHACSHFVDNNGETVSFNQMLTSSSQVLNTIVVGFACYRGS